MRLTNERPGCVGDSEGDWTLSTCHPASGPGPDKQRDATQWPAEVTLCTDQSEAGYPSAGQSEESVG